MIARTIPSGGDPAGAGGSLEYRLDIDGLRAVAVLPIVLYHAGLSALSGGFIGVDIFFVISGYLITRIIAREMDEQRFSLAGFYRRRILRIFPALFVMLGIVLVAGLVLMLPRELSSLGESVAAASASVSNILFWQETGYFSRSAETNPLLHTWSLGVEEQFYLFWPLMLLLANRLVPGRLGALLWLVIIGSLACGAALVVLSANAAFYLLPGRAWELAIGGVIALGAVPNVSRASLREALVWLGAITIAASYALVRSDQPFPVPTAIPACVGTALIIAYAPGTALAKLLSLGPVRAIGLISFSLYLWHWPLITFYRIETGMGLDLAETFWLVLASLVLATLSYFLVERTFLRRGKAWGTWPIIGGGLGVLVVLVAAGLWLSDRAGTASSYSDDALVLAGAAEYRSTEDFALQYGPGGCFVSSALAGNSEEARRETCENFVEGERNILLMGDSFGAQYADALVQKYPGANFSYAMASGCRPLVGGAGTDRCLAIMNRAFDQLLPANHYDLVVIGGRWQAEDVEHVAPTLRAAAASGARVVLIGAAVEYDYEFPAIMARQADDRLRVPLASRRVELPHELDPELQAIAASEGAAYWPVIELICPENECATSDPDGAPLHWDYGHLTLSGTRWVASRWEDVLAQNPARETPQ